MKTIGTLTILILGSALIAAARATAQGAPEIDPVSGMSALTLLTGAVLVLRSRRNN